MKTHDKDYHYEYYLRNKEKIQERQNRKRYCEFCDKDYKNCYWWSHVRSKKHIERSQFKQM